MTCRILGCETGLSVLIYRRCSLLFSFLQSSWLSPLDFAPLCFSYSTRNFRQTSHFVSKPVHLRYRLEFTRTAFIPDYVDKESFVWMRHRLMGIYSNNWSRCPEEALVCRRHCLMFVFPANRSVLDASSLASSHLIFVCGMEEESEEAPEACGEDKWPPAHC